MYSRLTKFYRISDYARNYASIGCKEDKPCPSPCKAKPPECTKVEKDVCPKKTEAPKPNPCRKSHRVYQVIGILLAIPLFAIATWVITRKHEQERPPFVKYSYLRIRTKKFPWGDGNHSLFHNPKVNPLPDGYEDDLENIGNGHGR